MKKIYRLIYLFLFLVFLAFDGNAQDTAANATTGTSPVDPQIVLFFVLGVSIVVLFVLLYFLYALNVFMNAMNKSGELKQTEVLFKFTDAVPIEREHEILLDHNYDGIHELDNKLPPWWVYMFYGTIIFAVVYMWYYHVQGDGNVQVAEYNQQIVEAEAQMKLAASKVNESSVTLITDKARLKKGEEVFQANCIACHGKKAEGGTVGPNLTDDYWLHGGDIKSVFKTIKYGVPVKGMIPWQEQLGPAQIQDVASYIKSLKGTNPPNARAPQGDLVKE